MTDNDAKEFLNQMANAKEIGKPLISRRIYYGKRIPWKVVERGIYKRITFLILTNGAHPCAYIRVPRAHRIYEWPYEWVNQEMMERELDAPHGWLTFRGEIPGENGVWLGWDYAHEGDRIEDIPCMKALFGSHSWSTQEIHEDIKTMIDNLKILAKDKDEATQ